MAVDIDRRTAAASVIAAGVAGMGGAARTQGPDQAERNAAAVRAHHERLNAGALDAAFLDWAEDALNHDRRFGRRGVAAILTDIWRTFPDARLDIRDLTASGDQVVVLVTFSGTHTGVGRLPVNGGLLVGVPPTGKRFEVQHIHWYTLRNGLIVNHRANRDDLGMMAQLGLMEGPGPFDWRAALA